MNVFANNRRNPVKSAIRGDRCPYCSFDPTSLSDYCEEHRPKWSTSMKSVGDELSEDILGKYSDEYLFEQLHNCCNPNCLVINEVIRRYKNKKKECEEMRKAEHYKIYESGFHHSSET